MVLVTVLQLFVLVLLCRAGEIDFSYDKKFMKTVLKPQFVDKTLFIQEFINHEGPLVIAAPDGFGKSFNLDMLWSFFTSQPNQQKMFRKTKIAKYKSFVELHGAQYAVLYCSFKQDQPVVDYQSLMAAFRVILHRTYALYPFLESSKNLTRHDKNKMTTYTGVKKFLRLQPIEMIVGLHFLSKLLRKHFQKDVIVMIDDYDTLILDSIYTNQLEVETVLGFHGALLTALVHNEFISRTILAGNTCIGIKPLVGLESVNCVGFLKKKEFAPFFGLTKEEVKGLLEKEKFKNMNTSYNKIKTWYGGYRSPDLSAFIFNTASTLKCLQAGKLRRYWQSTRTRKTLKFLLIEPVVQQLLNDSLKLESTVIQYKEKIQIEDLKAIKSFSKDEIWNEDFADAFFLLLMERGYFTFAEPLTESNYKNLTVIPPNREMGMVFEEIVTAFHEDSEELMDRLRIAVLNACVTKAK